MTDQLADLWKRSRSGAHAGRGFRYQDAVATHLALQGWSQALPIRKVIPEGLEDVSLLFDDGWIHAQAKSRLSLRGDFGIAEAVGHLMDVWTKHEQRSQAQPDSRVVLVLERPIHSLPDTGWMRQIAAVPELVTGLRAGLVQRAGNEARADALMNATGVVVIPEPREEGLETLSARLSLPQQACLVHYHAVFATVGDLADENRTRGSDNPAQLVVADIQRLMDDATSLIDRDALEAAIRQGICEVADFTTPILDQRFWMGVDVAPGHIVAGLPVERPELEDEILGGLFSRRVALVVGPSGAGKSALAWMSAYASRHLVRWYRVGRLRDEDVEPLLRLVRSGRPSDRAPVGLVVDDLGDEARGGWDHLVEQAAHLPGVLLLGTVREEDLPLLQTAHRCHQVRPKLDEELAERIWSELNGSGASRWPDWREPFERSQGLLLEYGYLLTTGERLAETITSQVERRLREGRDVELRALRLVAVADAWGATIRSVDLRSRLDVTEDELQRALWRLLDEHLIREASPGVLGGLHRVRSRHAVTATHKIPPPTLANTVGAVILALDAQNLQRFVTAIGVERVIPDTELLERLADRLRVEPNPRLLVAAFQALCLIGFRTLASGWIDILQEEAIPPAYHVTVAMVALAGSSANQFPPSIQAAVPRMAAVSQQDLRGSLLDRLSEPEFKAIVDRIERLDQAAALLASIAQADLKPRYLEALRSLGRLMTDGSTVELASCLAAARFLDVGLASFLAEQAGGSRAVLKRVERERPWLRGLTTDDDQVVVEGVVRFVAPSVQHDVHTEVVELCRLLLDVVPDVDVAACRAVDTEGNVAGHGGVPIADTRITRHNLPGRAEVAHNRARLHAIAALIGTETRTERLIVERTLIRKTQDLLAEAAEHYCRGNRPSGLARRCRRLAAEAESMLPAPATTAGLVAPLDFGEDTPIDYVASLVTGIAGHALVRLFDAQVPPLSVAAFIHDSLLGHANSLADPEHWSLLSDPPLESIEALQRDLGLLHGVVAERAVGKAATVALVTHGRRAPKGRALERCADLARKRAAQRLDASCQRLVEALAHTGLRAAVFRRLPAKPHGATWPPDEVAVAVQVPAIIDWLTAQHAVVEACRETFEPSRTVVAVPVRDGRIVASFGGTIGSEFFPIPDLLAEWESDLSSPFLDDRAGREMRRSVDALVELSGILGGATSGQLHDDEWAAVQAAVAQYEAAQAELKSLAGDDTTGIIRDVVGEVSHLAASVEAQHRAVQRGQPAAATLANAFASASRGVTSREVETVGLLRCVLVEWDVEPIGARDRVDEGLGRLVSDTSTA